MYLTILIRFKMTIAFLAIMVLANYYTGSWSTVLPKIHLQQFGISLDTVSNGELGRLFTSTFLSHHSGMFVRQIFLAAFSIGIHEWHFGWLKTLVIFTSVNLLSTLGLFVLLPIFFSQNLTEVSSQFDVGMSAGGFGLIGSLTFGIFGKQKFQLLFVVFSGLLLKLIFFPDVIADSVHVMAFPMGFGIAWLLSIKLKTTQPKRPGG